MKKNWQPPLPLPHVKIKIGGGIEKVMKILVIGIKDNTMQLQLIYQEEIFPLVKQEILFIVMESLLILLHGLMEDKRKNIVHHQHLLLVLVWVMFNVLDIERHVCFHRVLVMQKQENRFGLYLQEQLNWWHLLLVLLEGLPFKQPLLFFKLSREPLK